jgi:hypothetical protein
VENIVEYIASSSMGKLGEEDIELHILGEEPDEGNGFSVFTKYPYAVLEYELEEETHLNVFLFPEGEYFFRVMFSGKDAVMEKYASYVESWFAGMRIVER